MTNFVFSSPVANGRYFFQPEEIVRLEASDNYTSIYLSNSQKLLVCKVLKIYCEQLVPFGFIRTHRKHLVNKQHIQLITANSQLIMKDQSVVEISRRLKKEVLKQLHPAISMAS